jgi:endonuclease/exonuclease/phosphatase family metal-dependent hydrolase
MCKTLLLSLIFLLSTFHFQLSTAQTVAFWNVENLFDTIPSAFYDDAEYTPRGARKWSGERYDTKIRNLARVIDDMSADVVGLAEVENEAVVRDLIMALSTDYNYIHRTSGDSRGIDVAMLYKGDKFFPDLDPSSDGVRLLRSGTGREFLQVSGELSGERINFIVCHLASNLNSREYRHRNMEALREVLEARLAADPAANIIVMGDMNAVPGERLVRKVLGKVGSPWNFVCTPHWGHYSDGKGSYNYRGRWYLYDWMAVSPAIALSGGMRITGAGIFAREYMTEPTTPDVHSPRKPLRTFYGAQYLGGYSDHFPVWIVIDN